MSELTEMASGLEFPEGPIALADGSVIVVEIKRGTLTRVASGGRTEVVAKLGGGPNGAAIGPDGAIYVCNNGGFEWHEFSGMLIPGNQPEDYSGGRIERVDLRTGEAKVLYTECAGNPLRGPNDIVFDSDGGFFFTDHGKTRARDHDWGGVYYATPDGSSITEVLHPLDGPNGIGLSPDGSRLYVAETRPGRVWWWEVTAPGKVTVTSPLGPGGNLLAGVPGLQYFDSLAVEADGRVDVATIVNGGITSITPDGEVDHVSMPDPLTTNICFGGTDLTTAYITLSATGKLVSTKWPRPGLRLAYNA